MEGKIFKDKLITQQLSSKLLSFPMKGEQRKHQDGGEGEHMCMFFTYFQMLKLI